MNLAMLADNFMHPPVLFFFLGIAAVLLKSDLEIPPAIAKFFSIYLLFHIGFNGGVELGQSGITTAIMAVIGVCMLGSFSMPFISFRILRKKLDVYNAGAIAATYGSISAVTFATATSFLESHQVHFGGYMVAAMALMESPAIIAGLILISMALGKQGKRGSDGTKRSLGSILHESFFNGSVMLLMGSLLIGFMTGTAGEEELKPFVNDIYKGILCLYMLDMGLLAGSRLNELRNSGLFLTLFAGIYPLVGATLGLTCAKLLGLTPGDALLMTVLFGSASYIAVPAAMRMAVPQANMSLLLPMALGVTFTFNIALGIPLYYTLIKLLW